ncbi:MAG: helix-turn-helix domain-containing protein [Pseudorhodobacter sp.]
MYAAHSDDFRRSQTVAYKPAPECLSRKLCAGQHLFYESDRALSVYEVVSGVLRMTRVQKDGRRHVITFGFPGDVVGLPSEGMHTTECEAAIDTEVIAHRIGRLDRPDRDPKLHAFLMAAALDDIRMLQDHFLMLGRRLADEKVAAFLKLLLDRIGQPHGAYRLIRLPMNRSDIADYLGLTPETISRSISRLRSDKIIALKDPLTIVVRDPAGLRLLADGE